MNSTKKAGSGVLIASLLVAGPIGVLGFLGFIIFGSTSPAFRDVTCVPGQAVYSGTAGAWGMPMGASYKKSGGYGMRTHPVRGGSDLHTGIDIYSASRRAPILAASDGRIAQIVDLGNRSYGLYIDVDHGGGVVTRYAHLSRATVKTGDTVRVGQQIAVEGGSGGVTGDHLHYEVRVNNQPQDPVKAMAQRGLTFDGTAAVSGSPALSTALSTTSSTVLSQSVAELLPQPQGVDRSAHLSPMQLSNARVIIEEGKKAGLGPRAWIIALITSLQESDLGAHPSTATPNGDGDVGPFQQRGKVGWYADAATVAENTVILNDPAYAARTFYLGHDVAVSSPTGAGPVGYHIPGLLQITGWETMPYWKAAQKVQVSAFPMHYAKHEATVAGILAGVDLSIAPTDCNEALAEAGDVQVPQNAAAGDKVVAYAMTQLGVPYSWGGGRPSGPSMGHCCSPGGQNGAPIVGFDCSGLTLWAWSKVGVSLPHQSEQQQRITTPVPRDQIRAGDLLFFPGHVGLADGKGGMIEAPRPGVGVRITPNVLTDSYYGPKYTGAGRPTLPAQSNA